MSTRAANARISAIVVVVILVHALFVASAVVATEHSHLPAEQAMGSGARVPMPSLDMPGTHESRCFVEQSLAPARPASPGLGARVAVVVYPEAPSPVILAISIAYPHRPPDTVRALLQVYRI